MQENKGTKQSICYGHFLYDMCVNDCFISCFYLFFTFFVPKWTLFQHWFFIYSKKEPPVFRNQWVFSATWINYVPCFLFYSKMKIVIYFLIISIFANLSFSETFGRYLFTREGYKMIELNNVNNIFQIDLQASVWLLLNRNT